VVNTSTDRAGHDVQLLGRDRQAHEDHVRDVPHSRIDGCRRVQVTLHDVDACLGQHGDFLRVAGEDSDGFALFGEEARRLGSHLAGGGDENHGDASPAVEI
jgi:hypothetical protein